MDAAPPSPGSVGAIIQSHGPVIFSWAVAFVTNSVAVKSSARTAMRIFFLWIDVPVMFRGNVMEFFIIFPPFGPGISEQDNKQVSAGVPRGFFFIG